MTLLDLPPRVTIERQENEIRLRIRNLTTEDQGISSVDVLFIVCMIVLVNRYMGMSWC